MNPGAEENGLLQIRTFGAESCPREWLSPSTCLLVCRSSKQEVNRKFTDHKQELVSPSSLQHLSSIPCLGRFYWMQFAESCFQICRAEGKRRDAVLRQQRPFLSEPNFSNTQRYFAFIRLYDSVIVHLSKHWRSNDDKLG